jgi:hypothetical protein
MVFTQAFSVDRPAATFIVTFSGDRFLRPARRNLWPRFLFQIIRKINRNSHPLVPEDQIVLSAETGRKAVCHGSYSIQTVARET